ncbi:MAG: hypothetical protein GH155_00140 [Spirochaeta sp.]|nr:hypothetical protein [Spirochaeta sp.]
MVDVDKLRKVQQVYKEKHMVSRPSGKVDEYHYWYGHWYENGKVHRVYLGKEVPKSLQYLLDGKKLGPAGIVYLWPNSTRGGRPAQKKAGHSMNEKGGLKRSCPVAVDRKNEKGVHKKKHVVT